MSARKELRAVTFDMGGTLIKPWPSVGHVYADVAAQHGHKLSGAVLNQRFAKAWREFENFNHTREQWAAIVDETFSGLIAPVPSETFFQEIYDRFSDPQAWHIFEDVQPAIDSLAARGINLAVISNWDDRLQPLLDKLDLTKYFETIIVSCDVGFAKPSPVIFEHAAKKLGLAPELILHVGDSAEQDVAGAKKAGFQTRLLNRGATDPSLGVITSLTELSSFE